MEKSNRIIESIFKYKTVDFNELIKFGFIKNNNNFVYSTLLTPFNFNLSVIVNNLGEVSTKVIDLGTNEPYTLFLVEDAVGEFVGGVRTKYEQVLTNISNNCFYKEIFKTDKAKQIIKYVNNKYNNELEFLWEKFPDIAIWRRSDIKKWYGLLCVLPKNKLGVKSDEIIEILNIRISPEMGEKLIDNNNYFKGYHMNKKSWISINLNGNVNINQILNLIDLSFELAKK